MAIETPPPVGLLDSFEARALKLRSGIARIPVAESMLDDLEVMLSAYVGLTRSSHGPDAMSAALLFRDKIRPRLDAIVRGNFDYFDGRHPLIVAAMTRLTEPKKET